jgi:hypothetical protein
MNIFNAKLDITAVTPVVNEINKWDIVASFTDNTGVYYATDTIPGDIIYIDGTPYNLGILRYKVTAIDTVQTDFNNLYVTVQWDAYTEVSEPYTGFETCMGRTVLGSVFLPAPTVQGLSQSFMDYVRNLESTRQSQVSFINRTFNGPYNGARDGFNQVFQIIDSFILETLEVHVNGIRQNMGDINTDPNDYVLISANEVQFTITPTDKDILTFNYNKKM